jgi:hypothetical protein
MARIQRFPRLENPQAVTSGEGSKMSKEAIVLGALNGELRANGRVETSFTVGEAVVMRPMLAKNLDTAEQDFIRTYGLTPAQAAAFRARIERDGSASVPAAV